jgi:hypothetical protein
MSRGIFAQSRDQQLHLRGCYAADAGLLPNRDLRLEGLDALRRDRPRSDPGSSASERLCHQVFVRLD